MSSIAGSRQNQRAYRLCDDTPRGRGRGPVRSCAWSFATSRSIASIAMRKPPPLPPRFKQEMERFEIGQRSQCQVRGEMVGEAGLEPATPGLEGRCSIQLSYSPALNSFYRRIGAERMGECG